MVVLLVCCTVRAFIAFPRSEHEHSAGGLADQSSTIHEIAWTPRVVGQEQRVEWESLGKSYHGSNFSFTSVCFSGWRRSKLLQDGQLASAS